MIKYFIIILLFAGLFWFLKFDRHYPEIKELRADNKFWGVTFSIKMASQLDLDWSEIYDEIINDLQVKQIRLPIYWDEIEQSKNEFDFSKFDAILDRGAEAQVKFLVAVGWRLPRWPECHTPAWLKNSDPAKIKQETLVMLKTVIERYRDRPEIIAWQVENEPLVDWFGECPAADQKFLEQEIGFVRSLDSRPIIITVPGEMSNWKIEANLSDRIGTSIYRVTWNKWFGYWRWPLPAKYYRWKAERSDTTEKIMVSELQAEPWSPSGRLVDLSAKERDKSFSLEQFRANLQLAQNIGWQPNYLWGAEWWYWQKKQGNSEYWNLAKSVFNQ